MIKLPKDWSNLEKLILNILTANLSFILKENKITLNCTFENIAKGRCLVNIKEEKQTIENGEILIFSDKAFMEINISYNKFLFEKILFWLENKHSRKKKLILSLSKGLFINKKGYLHVEEKAKIKVLDSEWIIPII